MATPFGKYMLQRKLAEGGMAEVFLARQTGLEGFEKLCVVKRILPSLSSEHEFIQMFLNEARVAARLNHPNVAQIWDLGKVDELYFICMEYVHGEDLRELMAIADKKKMRPPLGLVVRLLADTLAGLHYAHTRTGADGKALGLVHRDVSPANIIVTYEGSVKVVDFGIAKATQSTSEQTRAGLFKGKFAYMSPEQARGQPLDARSDVFACGILLWELLAWQRLFKRAGEVAMMKAVAEDPIPSPRKFSPQVPEALERICMRALERPLERRYPNALEMRADLEALSRELKWEADALALGKYMHDLFGDKLKAQAADIRAAGLASLDDFLLTVEDSTAISWMEPRSQSTGSNSAPARPVATVYDDDAKPTEVAGATPLDPLAGDGPSVQPLPPPPAPPWRPPMMPPAGAPLSSANPTMPAAGAPLSSANEPKLPASTNPPKTNDPRTLPTERSLPPIAAILDTDKSLPVVDAALDTDRSLPAVDGGTEPTLSAVDETAQAEQPPVDVRALAATDPLGLPREGAATAPMGVPVGAATAKRPAWNPPPAFRRAVVIGSAATIAAAVALTVVFWPRHDDSPAPSIAVVEPPKTTATTAPPVAPRPPPPTTATLVVTVDADATISIDGKAQATGKSATVTVTAGVPHTVSAQRPGHSVHSVSVEPLAGGDRVPVAIKLR